MAKSTNIMKLGFFAGLGSSASFMINIAIAMLFFIPGFILLRREKVKRVQDESTKILAYILMGIGMIVGLGFGSGTFLTELANNI